MPNCLKLCLTTSYDALLLPYYRKSAIGRTRKFGWFQGATKSDRSCRVESGLLQITVFDLYAQAERSYPLRAGSTGLALALRWRPVSDCPGGRCCTREQTWPARAGIGGSGFVQSLRHGDSPSPKTGFLPDQPSAFIHHACQHGLFHEAAVKAFQCLLA